MGIREASRITLVTSRHGFGNHNATAGACSATPFLHSRKIYATAVHPSSQRIIPRNAVSLAVMIVQVSCLLEPRERALRARLGSSRAQGACIASWQCSNEEYRGNSAAPSGVVVGLAAILFGGPGHVQGSLGGFFNASCASLDPPWDWTRIWTKKRGARVWFCSTRHQRRTRVHRRPPHPPGHASVPNHDATKARKPLRVALAGSQVR